MVVYNATLTWQRTNFRPVEKFDRILCSHGTVNVFALFTRNLEPLSVRLSWLRVYGTPKARIFDWSKIRAVPCEHSFSYIFTLYIMSEDWGEVCSRSYSYINRLNAAFAAPSQKNGVLIRG